MTTGNDDTDGGAPTPPDNRDITSAEAMREQLRLFQELARLENENLVAKSARIELERTALAVEVKSLQHSNEAVKLARQSNELRIKEIESVEAKLAMDREHAREQAALNTAAGDAEAARLRASFALKEAELERKREAARSIEATEAQTKNLVKLLTRGVGDQWKETFAGGFMVAALDGTESLTNKMQVFRDSLIESLSPANLLGSLLMKVGQATLKLALEQDAAIAAFNKSTSSMGEYNDQIISVERASVGLGISTQDSAKAFGSLLTGVTDFAHAGAPVPTQLATTAAQMEKLGVSTDLTAKTMENAMRVMGMSAEESQALTGELASMAIQMKLPIEQVTEGFNAAMPALAKFGADAPDIFKKVQVASRSLGVAVGDLLSVMGQFDTFSGAAEAAGKLNAILGGDLLNSTELLLATEDERLRMIRESLDMSGRSFDSMGRFEKQAITNALGIQDVATATKMLTGDMDKFGDALDANPLTKEETEERIRKTQAITDKMAETWRMFAMSLRPAVEGLHNIMSGLFELNEMADGWLVKGILLVSAIFSIGKAWTAVAGMIKASTASAMGPLGVFIGAFGAIYALLESMEGKDKMLWSAAAALGGVAGAIAMIAISSTLGAAAPLLIAGFAAMAAAGIGASMNLFDGASSGEVEVGGFADQALHDGGFAKGGPTLVGEEGPELVMMPPMANVINNDNFTEVIAQSHQAASQPQQNAVAQQAPPPQKPTETTVVIKIGNQEMGRAVIKAIESVPGYNLRGLPRGA